MKTFILTISVQTTDDFDPQEFKLCDHDVIDGFELTRNTDDITNTFKMESARIENVQEI